MLTSKANAKAFAEPVVFWLIASRFSLSEKAEDRVTSASRIRKLLKRHFRWQLSEAPKTEAPTYRPRCEPCATAIVLIRYSVSTGYNEMCFRFSLLRHECDLFCLIMLPFTVILDQALHQS